MGWTSYHANYYKNGTVDRKKECDAYFMEGLNKGHFEVLKSTMVGSTYYAAVKILVKDIGGNSYELLPENEQEVFAAVFLTSTDINDWYNFSYKELSEFSGPYHQTTCPASILKLLSPTESAWANEWRNKCWKNIERKKNPNSLEKLPVGSVIEFEKPSWLHDSNLYENNKVTLTKVKGRKQAYWFDGIYRWKKSLIPEDFELIKRG